MAKVKPYLQNTVTLKRGKHEYSINTGALNGKYRYTISVNYFKYFRLPIQYDFFISVTDIIADPIIGTALLLISATLVGWLAGIRFPVLCSYN